MLCIMVKRQLSAYLDGELNAKATAKVAQHLEQCSACREELERLNCLTGRLAEMAQEPLPADFHEVLMARIRREEEAPAAPVQIRRPAKRFGRYMPALGGALAALLLFVLAVPVLQSGRSAENAMGANVPNAVSADGLGSKSYSVPDADSDPSTNITGLPVGAISAEEAAITAETAACYDAVYQVTAADDAQRKAIASLLGIPENGEETTCTVETAKLQQIAEKLAELAGDAGDETPSIRLDRVTAPGADTPTGTCLFILK